MFHILFISICFCRDLEQYFLEVIDDQSCVGKEGKKQVCLTRPVFYTCSSEGGVVWIAPYCAYLNRKVRVH